MPTNTPISLYIHFPWCVRKCPYCDFNSHNLTNNAMPEQDYVNALIADFKANAHYFQNRSIHSIFMGGGTPSLFSGQSMGLLLENINNIINIPANAEITMEANPGTIEHDDFKNYKLAGINRVSLGVQSFNEKHLKILGRIHNQQQIYKAVHELEKAHINNFNLDLMFALPEQTIDEAIQDLQAAIYLNPQHISWYQLTLEPNTPFYYKPPKNIPNDEIIIKLQHSGQALLQQHNFLQYEVSAYSKQNFQSQHNLNYWQFGDYLGIGAGAHSKITIFENSSINNIIRFSKEKYPNKYFTNYNHNIFYPADNIMLEFLMNNLRLKQGFYLPEFTKITNINSQILLAKLQNAINKNLLNYDKQNNLINTTELGFMYLDEILLDFS